MSVVVTSVRSTFDEFEILKSLLVPSPPPVIFTVVSFTPAIPSIEIFVASLDAFATV